MWLKVQFQEKEVHKRWYKKVGIYFYIQRMLHIFLWIPEVHYQACQGSCWTATRKELTVWDETTVTAPTSLDGVLCPKPPSRPQSANAAFAACDGVPLIQRAEIIWSSDYYGSPVPFKVSFQACDMWLFACSLIALNNQREGLDIDMTHRQEWVSWLSLLMNYHFLWLFFNGQFYSLCQDFDIIRLHNTGN